MSRKDILQGQKKINRHDFRRNSLDSFIKTKNISFQQQSQSFRKSCTSFDKIKPISKQQLPQIKSDKQIDNIYFNPHSRANFFKNLIDSYFTKNQQNLNKSNQKKFTAESYLMKRSLLNRKQQNTGISLQNNVSRQIKNAKRKSIEIQQKKNEESPNLQKLKDKQKKKISLRYKQQNKNHQLVEKDQQLIQRTSISQNKSKMIAIPNGNETSFLPKITETGDDFDFELEHINQPKLQFIQTTDTFMRGSSSFSLLEKKSETSLVYENSILKIYKVSQGKQRRKIKQFKNYIFIERLNKAVSFGALSIWNQYRFHELSLQTDNFHSLRDNLYKIFPNPTYPDKMIIQAKPLYFKLVANQCQQIFMMFRQLVFDLSKTQKKVINNSINPSNLYMMRDGKLRLGDWQYSAFRGQNQIRGGHFQSRTQPLLKCQNQWLVEPEYVAPQILQSVLDIKKQFDLWKWGNISDIYSLGLTFLQIITLIPININRQTSIKNKSTILRPRQGLLATINQSIPSIIENQKNIVQKMTLTLQRQISPSQQNQKFFTLLLKMIEPDRQKRISFDQLIKEIK